METVNHETYVSLEMAKLLKQLGFDGNVKRFIFAIMKICEEWATNDKEVNK